MNQVFPDLHHLLLGTAQQSVLSSVSLQQYTEGIASVSLFLRNFHLVIGYDVYRHIDTDSLLELTKKVALVLRVLVRVLLSVYATSCNIPLRVLQQTTDSSSSTHL